MDGWWKPAATWAIFIGALVLLLFVLLDWPDVHVFAMAMTALWMTPFLAMYYAFGALPVRFFLKGMRDSGVHYHVTSDRIGWLAGRATSIQTIHGTWLIESDANPRHATLHVTDPQGVRQRVRGRPRKAGRRAMEEFLAPPPPETEKKPWFVSPTGKSYRVHMIVVILLLSVTALVVPAMGLARTEVPWKRDILWALHWLGIGAFWFIGTVAGATAVMHWTRGRRELSRRAGGAGLLVGAASGLVVTGILHIAFATVRGEALVVAPLGEAMAALGALPALAVSAWESAPARILLTLGAGIVAASCLFAVAPFFVWCSAAIVVIALIQTWTKAAPTLVPPTA